MRQVLTAVFAMCLGGSILGGCSVNVDPRPVPGVYQQPAPVVYRQPAPVYPSYHRHTYQLTRTHNGHDYSGRHVTYCQYSNGERTTHYGWRSGCSAYITR